MSKIKIHIDIDGTIWRAMERLVDILNSRYNSDVDWKTVKKYDMSDKFPVEEGDILEIFNGEFFINIDRYLMPRVNQYLEKLARNNELCVVSVGSRKNINLKSEYMNLFPDISSFIFLASNDKLSSKSVVDMSNGIFIDDCLKYLNETNARYKILFSHEGVKTEFNGYLKNKEGYFVCHSWKEVYETICKIKGGDC